MLHDFEHPPVWLPNGEDEFDAVIVTASGEQRRVPWRRLPLVVEAIGAQRGSEHLGLALTRDEQILRAAFTPVLNV
ncbi:hypothetical protein LAUMK4_05630 [Mycobacterium persicum]|uniref:Uncharacterized protein n=1 Tax=Mycobacterium persicum TaxID=1487726 RepID=A0ABY6RRX9_9MYCO|nr:hypothetical protein [Mycobacterium persicum]VBA31951.1 hypothetical protein LAUMK4_05630 [Mycobacterium persicum]